MAKSIYKKYPKAIVHILEKENLPGKHTSGRNSGVIHAGIYYGSDSLKAKFCKEGNRRLTQYCYDNNIDIINWGKFIAASDEEEYGRLHDIYRQGVNNGIQVQLMGREEAMRKEPLLRGYGNDFIYSPSTSVANPLQVIHCLSEELKTKYGDYCTQFYEVPAQEVITAMKRDLTELRYKDMQFETKYLINWAGQQALEIAQMFQYGDKYLNLPIKGNYLISNRVMNEVKTPVYPVPLKNTYFLGVHSTIMPDGRVKIGPSATPAFSPENYGGFKSIQKAKALGILGTYFRMLFTPQFNTLAMLAAYELPKLNINNMIESCRKIHAVDPNAFTEWYPPGIRAQLVDKNTLEFVGDFKLEYDGYSMHVLNAISPGWTWASPFADHIVDEITKVFSLSNPTSSVQKR